MTDFYCSANIPFTIDPYLTAQHHGNIPHAVALKVLWDNGSILKVGLDGGSDFQRGEVMSHVKYWEEHMNITFTFPSAGPYDIFVSFHADKGSWSLLGKNSRVNASANPPKPSMNLGWVEEDSFWTWGQKEENRRSAILHEFGHALGLGHEQWSPNANLDWDKEFVYADMLKNNPTWTRADVDMNVFAKYQATDVVVASNFDPHSVMLYEIKKGYTKNGFVSGHNTWLSQTDKTYINYLYPLSKGEGGTWKCDYNSNTPGITRMHRIAFGQAYKHIPSIAVGLNYLDFERNHNLRVKANVSDIDNRGMTAKLESWADTQMYQAGITYFELSEKFKDDVQIGTAAITMGERNTRHAFARPFAENKAPAVILWFKDLDLDNTKDYSVRSWGYDTRWGEPLNPVDSNGFGISTGLSWGYNASLGTPHLYGGEVTWIAVAQDAPGICCGNITSYDRPARCDFPRPFTKTPKVLVGFNAVSGKHGYYMRVRSKIISIDQNGFTWDWESWGDDAGRGGAEASYVAYEE